MLVQPSFSVLVAAEDEAVCAPLLTYLNAMPHVHLTVMPKVPRDLGDVDAVVTAAGTGCMAAIEAERRGPKGCGWLMR